MMKKYYFLLLMLLGAMVNTMAQSTVAVTDTITITVDQIQPEPDPNAGTYTFSFWGPDNSGTRQKVQIEYLSASVYGTFTNNDFRNWDGSEGSGSYNYMRPTNSDFKFYPFKNELTAVVADSMGATVIDVNGLINDLGRWKRVLLHGVIPAPAPDDTINVDLGLVSVIPNAFLDYLELHAANSEYSLATGIMGHNVLAAGTYYMADLLRPELVTADGDTIMPASAELTITTADAGQLDLVMSLLGEDNILYLLSMHTGTVEITDTVVVNCASGQVIYNQIYDMFQFQGQSAEYIAVLSVSPGVLTNDSVVDVPVDSIQLTMTSVIDLTDSSMVHIFDAHATVTVDPSNTRHAIVSATMLGVNGVCYEVTIPIGFSIMPEAKDTFYVDMGEGVEALRYRDDSYVELRLSTLSAGIDVVFWNYYHLAGTYEMEDFDYESDYGNFMMLVNEEDKTYQFRDIQAAEMQIDSIGDTLHITIHAMLSGDTLYVVTAKMGPKTVLGPEDQSYDISATAGYDMVALHAVSEDGTYALTRLQFQTGLDDEGEVINGNAALWTFTLASESLNSIGGEYSYSLGTIDEQTMHIVYEDTTEIVLKPVAGTLTLTPIAPVTIGGYHTWRYAVRAYFVAANGVVYELEGENTLLCVDNTTGSLYEMQEKPDGFDEVQGEQGLRVKKVLRDGILLIERDGIRYNAVGARL